MNLVFVGELNPYGSDPRFALYTLPRKASGNRLREHLGLSDGTYGAIHKVNLCDGKWRLPAAREVARKIRQKHDVIVMLGTKVKSAFWTGFGFTPPPIFPFEVMRWLYCSYVYLPHPSGRNLVWNLPTSRQKARDAMKAAAPEIPWGSYPLVVKGPA